MSSESAFVGQPGNSIYVASKWAVEGWAESLAFEVDQFGIDVLLDRAGPLHHRHLAELAAHSPGGQRLPPVGAVSVPRHRRARRRQGPRSARGGSSALPTCSRRRAALPQSGRPPGAHRSFRAREIPEPLAAPRFSRPIWACGACACSLIATAAQALGSAGYVSLKSRQIPCKCPPPAYRSGRGVRSAIRKRTWTRDCACGWPSWRPLFQFWQPCRRHAADDDCKDTVKAEGKPASLRDLGAYPNSLLAWRSAVKDKYGGEYNSWRYAKDAKVDCTEKAGQWVCVRTAKPCKDLLQPRAGRREGSRRRARTARRIR